MHVRFVLCSLLAVFGVFAGTPAFAAVHPGDELYVTVFDHPELTGPVTVDTTNHISLPLAGFVDVRNLDAKQIAVRVRTQLAEFIQQPAVNVQLKAQQFTLFIAGGPGGTLKYEPGETLVSALGDLAPRLQEIPSGDGSLKTGDLSSLERSRLDLTRVGVAREGASLGTFDVTELSATGKSGPILQPGDTLAFVDKPTEVHVIGEVVRPGSAYLSPNEPLADAVSQVGGILPTAATSHIALASGGATQMLALGDTRFNSPAQPGDTITVPAAPRVNIVGLVDKPGAVVLKTDASLLSALYEAGGPTKWADLTHVQVIANGAKSSYNVTSLIHGDMTQDPQLKDGDVVFVPEGHKLDVGGIFQTILGAALFFK